MEHINVLSDQYLPCKASELVGQNIDVFHKDPSYQRGILANDGAKLPVRAIIDIGPEKADLLVSAVKDKQGNYLGPMVTWEVVTEKLKLEVEQARLQSMVENSPTNVVLCDTEGTILYSNPATVRTLRGLEQYLPCRADELVGRSFDIFHKNPSYQRGIIADPKNLPHQAKIQVGPETLDLLVSAITDNKGKYIGAVIG